jgi:acetylornithine deacetylase/succinyl-diaminopimelate desuccinylase-like protein
LRLATFGARGFMSADITVYGARRGLHSGNFGNWAPNPALALARLLASMKDDNGRVLIRDFYAGVEPLLRPPNSRRCATCRRPKAS